MSAEKFTVHVINPKAGRKKTTKKKAAKNTARRKKGPKKVAKKKAASKKRKRRAAPKAAPRKRRRSNPAPKKKKRRRRKNPDGVGMLGLGGLIGEAKKALPRLAGKLAVAWAVRRWGGTGSVWGGGVVTSPTAGESWTWKQYGIALLVAQFGPKVFGKFVDASGFRQGAMDLIVTKAVWTEGIARSPWAQQQFGTGDVMADPGNGQLYWDQGGRQVAMQGLVQASSLDALVEASPLDGPNDYSYGHLMPTGTSAQEQATGLYQGSGYVDPYHAAYAA